jgi:orotidine-5'-phosphate decarboxylase
MTYADRLHEAVRKTDNACLVGIDPHLALLPEPFAAARDTSLARAERARLVGDFGCQVVDLVAGRVPAVKPQSAFFEVLGADGVAAFERVVAAARDAGLIVIGDVKRGDIASTAAAYADAFLDRAGAAPCDAVTLNPFLGADSVGPFVEACAKNDAGLYVLVRTSNPGSADFQRHGDPELSFAIADAVVRWGAELTGACGLSSVGAVVGATHGEELRAFRDRMPHTPFLLPGFGAQGAGAADVVDAFLSDDSGAPQGALINSSRGITFAWRNEAYADLDWKDAASAALDAMVAELGAAYAART